MLRTGLRPVRRFFCNKSHVPTTTRAPHTPDTQQQDWLPAERVWEGAKPESEVLSPAANEWFTDVACDPKLSDNPDEYGNIPLEAMLTLKYPQFAAQGRKDGKLVTETWKQEWKQLTEREQSVFALPHWTEIFPDQYDVIIIGGGIIGSSIAFHIRHKIRELMSVLVIEKDARYLNAATTNAMGGISQQFQLPENLQMAHYGSEFIRNAKDYLSFLDDPPPDLHFTPSGYLYLSDTSDQADTILENQLLQTDYGSYVDVLNPHQIEKRFPWLNTEDVLIGAHGVQDEGYVDPFAYLLAVRGKAEFLGAMYMHAEFLDFNLCSEIPSHGLRDDVGNTLQTCNRVIVRLPDGRERQIKCAYVIIAAGHESGNITKKLNIGCPDSTGIRTVPLPVEKRKRYVFVFNCEDGPGLDFPILVDGTGVWCRRDGLGGNFVCGKYMTEDEEPDPSNLDIDYSFFQNKIWPVLAKRVKAFEKLKIVNAWATYDDYNYFDQQPIIGQHPYYRMGPVWACGFSGHGLQMAPAVGRAITELFDTGWLHYQTIDLARFGWGRILNGKPLRERKIVPPLPARFLPDPNAAVNR